MAAELYQSFYVSANQYDVGPSSGTPSAYQKHNATQVQGYFTGQGWTLNAICGMLGNMMYESCLDPACVYPKSRFPHGGATLADLDNTYAINITGSAYGLVQWRGTTSTAPAGNQLVSYAIRHGYQWYSGNIQLARLQWEWSTNNKFHPQTIDGTYWTFQVYAQSTQTPEYLANIFMRCYEGTSSVISTRKANARTWYDYFGGTLPPEPPGPPDPPGPEPPTEGWITGEEFAQMALSYNGQYMPYDQYDCIGFVNKVWQGIPTAVGSLPNGTNAIWRSSLVFATTSPYGQLPTPVLWYKNTLDNVLEQFGTIPNGALLFHKISDEGPPPLPSQYEGDGIGNFVHVGIYCGNDRVMQSGGKDSASVPGGGVHLSRYDPTAWNYVAYVAWVDSTGTGPMPPGPIKKFPPWLLFKFKGRGLILG